MSPTNSRTILVVAPHPDDETLGCGGTLLRHVANGDSVHWLVMTAMTIGQGFAVESIERREREIATVASAYGFAGVHQAGFPTMLLDTVPKSDLVGAVSNVMRSVQPDTVYLPYRNDAHSDHAAVFDAGAACCKQFRYPSVRRVRAYETLSETEFGLRSDDPGFRPTLWVDISAWIERKIEIMKMFPTEMAPAPFPRSVDAILALATVRGLVAGTSAAEAFISLREIE
jgi:LmbE family N-acetylglucosaminyl deacetylase